ncbi:hypothetical protein LSH36_330g01014 [Paralvinella palmiformis]|uniref:Uncharacterized protein n=1 Tax=Paralvinella palmiformis TaxID=53620 RepID=A0AAD9JFS6_9ANNE|nr:hypothetical protein LSH36_330g01014 [Paralvinella palmiformis]
MMNKLKILKIQMHYVVLFVYRQHICQEVHLPVYLYFFICQEFKILEKNLKKDKNSVNYVDLKPI